MNRATKFTIGLLATTALLVIFFSSRGEKKQEALIYESVEACTKAGVQDAATCQAEFVKAQNRHNEVAPRYAAANECYSEYGYNRCYRSRTSGGSFWLPFMVGYMLAPRGVRGVYTQPLYRPSRDTGNFYTARNGRIGAASSAGRTQVAKTQVSRPPQARTRTVARGGFGARARSSGS